MTVAELLREVEAHGATVEPAGDNLAVNMPTDFPDSLLDRVRENKRQILEHLRRHHEAHLSSRYRRLYSGDGPNQHELSELERRVTETGMCLAWCEELRDFVAFVRNDYDPKLVPPGFVVYFEAELEHVASLSAEGLRRIHAAKKTGAVVRRNEPDPEA